MDSSFSPSASADHVHSALRERLCCAPEVLALPLERLRALLEAPERVWVAYSGGVDSALLLVLATAWRGASRTQGVLGLSASLGSRERQRATAFAEKWHLPLTTVHTRELDVADYVRNDGDRCFHCKTTLFSTIHALADAAPNHVTLVDGFNTDDASDHRPGHRAAKAQRVRSPYAEASVDKATIRGIARHLELEVAEKPAAACLSSRIAYGQPVSAAVLAQVDRAENALSDLGFSAHRVRVHGALARIEVPATDLPRAFEKHAAILDAVSACGFAYVTLDLAGYRRGSHNRVLPGTGSARLTLWEPT